MMETPAHQRLRDVITSSIINLCSSNLDFDSEVTVEGLLGVTVDRKEIILINVKEVVLASQAVAIQTSSYCDFRLSPCSEDVPSNSAHITYTELRKTKRKAPPHKLPYDERGISIKKPCVENEDSNSIAHKTNCSTESRKLVNVQMALGSDLQRAINALTGDGVSGCVDVDGVLSEDSQLSQWMGEELDVLQKGASNNGDNGAEDGFQCGGPAAAAESIVIDDEDSNYPLQDDTAPSTEGKTRFIDSVQDSESPLPSPYPPVYMLPTPPKRVVRKHDPLLMAELVQKIRAGTMTLADASRQYNIPRPTLSDKVRGRTPITKDKQNRRVLDPEEEEELVVWCLERASQGDMPCMADFMKELDRYLVNHGRNSLANSKEWTKSFLRRHPELTDSGITFDLRVT